MPTSSYKSYKSYNNKFHIKIEDNIRKFALFVLVFFTIYRLTIPELSGQLTSTRICILVLFLWVITKDRFRIVFEGINTEYQFRSYIKILVMFLLYSLILLPLNKGGSDYTIASDYFEFIVFWGMCYYSLSKLFHSNDEAMHVLLLISLFQSLIILLCVFIPNFRTFINTTFNSLSYWNTARNAEEMYNIGYAYGIGCMTSTGSLQLALGELAALYFMLQNGTRKLPYVFSLAFITLASTMLSRTGLGFSAVCVVFFILANVSPRKFLRIGSGLLVVLLVSWWILNHSFWSDMIMSRFSRLFYLKNNGLYSSYFKVFDSATTFMPSLSENFIIGTGITSGTTGTGIRVNVDSGYLKTYSALGLFFAIVFYAITIGIMTKLIAPLKRTEFYKFGICFIIIILLGEAKEQLISGYMLCFLFIICTLIEKEQQK